MKKVLFTSILLLIFACSSWAYEEKFDKGKADGWEPQVGKWDVKDGEYVCTTTTSNTFCFYEPSVNNPDWADYTLEVQVKPIPGVPYAGVLFRVQAKENPPEVRGLLENSTTGLLG